MDDQQRADLDLMKKAERVLTQLDRLHGLEDAHADVLAALRIRIEGGPRKSLEELMDAAGEISGKRAKELDDRIAAQDAKKSGDLADLLAKEPKRSGSLDDLLSAPDKKRDWPGS